MTKQQKDNVILPFNVITAAGVGRLVRLGSTVDAILTRHEYPYAVSVVLGKLIAFAAGLANSLKFKGVLTIELKGDGRIPLMVADVTSEGAVRGYAKVTGDIPDYEKIQDSHIPALFGKGNMMFTIDQSNGGKRYQGIVELEHKTLEECAAQYFEKSAQFFSVFRLACAKTSTGWRAGCITLQRLPAEEQKRDVIEEARRWEHVSILLKSTKAEELIDGELSGEELLLRLYHEDGVKVFDSTDLKDLCRCTREKMLKALGNVPKTEIDTILNADGNIEIHCEYCNEKKYFRPEDIGIKPL